MAITFLENYSSYHNWQPSSKRRCKMFICIFACVLTLYHFNGCCLLKRMDLITTG